MNRLKWATIVAGVLLASVFSSPICADTLSLEPSTSSVNAGGTVTLNVDISGTSNLYAFQFDVDFDPTVVTGISVAEGPFLIDDTAMNFTYFIPGTVSGNSLVNTANTLLGPETGVSGMGTLAVLTLQIAAGATGSTSLDLANVILLDDGGPLTLNGATININSMAVPEPDPLVMLIAGLAVFSLFRRASFYCSKCEKS
jgi:Cohesin domain